MKKLDEANWGELSPNEMKSRLQEAISQTNWPKLTLEERKTVVRDFERYSEQIQQRGSIPVVFQSFNDPNQCGAYSDLHMNMQINERLLASNDVNDKYRLFEVMFHEGRHAYQHEVTTLQPGKHGDETNANRDKWTYNLPPAYIVADAKNPLYALYGVQATERDAFFQGINMANDFFQNMHTDAQSYLHYREKNDFLAYWKESAKLAIGDNCEQKTDIITRSIYLKVELKKLGEQVGNITNPTKEQEELAAKITAEANAAISVDNSILTMTLDQLQAKAQMQEQIQRDMDTLANQLNLQIKPQITDQPVAYEISELKLFNKEEQAKTAVKIWRTVGGEQDAALKVPLTGVHFERTYDRAASAYLNGEDRNLAEQLKSLHEQRQKMELQEKRIMEFGRENGLDTTVWRHMPNFLKGEGLKYYEAETAKLANQYASLDKKEAEINEGIAKVREMLNTPEAKAYIEKTATEYLRQEQREALVAEQAKQLGVSAEFIKSYPTITKSFAENVAVAPETGRQLKNGATSDIVYYAYAKEVVGKSGGQWEAGRTDQEIAANMMRDGFSEKDIKNSLRFSPQMEGLDGVQRAGAVYDYFKGISQQQNMERSGEGLTCFRG